MLSLSKHLARFVELKASGTSNWISRAGEMLRQAQHDVLFT